MAAYFARRLAGGMVTLFLASLLLYSLLLYTPGSIYSDLQKDAENTIHERGFSGPYLYFLTSNFSVDRPWPLNYVSWLLNPNETRRIILDKNDGPLIIHKGIDLTVGKLHFVGSGILTGDLGISMYVARGVPVTDIFGPGFGEFMLRLPLILLASMALVLIQRWCRPIKSPRHLVPFSARKSLAQSIGPMVGFYLSRLN